MAREQIDLLVHLLDLTFETDPPHSVLNNLATVREEDWEVVPPGAMAAGESGRSIRDIVLHLGSAMYMYHNKAFGDGELAWPAMTEIAQEPCLSLASAVEWLKQGHTRLRASFDGLTDDAQLAEERGVHFGGTRPARAIATTMIQHNIYHSGEINHLRAILQETDRFRGAVRPAVPSA